MLTLLLPLSGCRVPFKPAEGPSKNGYRETQLSPAIFRVRYRWALEENPFFGSRPSLVALVLLRSADLTIEQGCRYFLVDPISLGGEPAPEVSLIIKVFREPPQAEGVEIYDAQSIRQEIRQRYPYLASSPEQR